MIEFLILIITIIIVYDIMFRFNNKRVIQYASMLPGPPSLPLIGNGYLFRGNTKDLYNIILKLLNKFPSPFKLWFSYRFYTVVYRPEHVEIILNKALEKDPIYRITLPFTGEGLFASPVSKWRIHRKLIQPTFNTRILENFFPVFQMQSEILCKLFENELDGDYFDAFKYLSPCTLDIICETAMGYKVSAQTGGNVKYVECAVRQLKIQCTRMCKVWLQPDFIFNLTPLAKIQKENLSVVHNVSRTVIKQKLEQYRKQKAIDDMNNNNNNNKEGSKDESFSKRKAFLDYLIEISENGYYKFSERNLQDEVDTMMIAGNDTTASVNSYVLLMLGIHQDIQEKVYQEIYDIFGDSDRPCDHEDVKRMSYLEMVIKETMRLFPPGPIIMRYLTRDLQIDKYTIPANTGCAIAIARTHRLPDIWPEPDKFDPDRFLPSEVAKRHPYAFIPFSAGPRNCIGGRYAFMSMRCVLSTILRKYRVYSDVKLDTIELEFDFFLKPVAGYRIRLERRNATYV